MNIFSKLFSTATPLNQSPDKSKHISHLQGLFSPQAEIFTQVPIFNQNKKHMIDYMMIHPHAGLILFNYFMYDASELKGITASPASSDTTNADIKTTDAKSFLKQRFDEIFHTQLSPIRSVLICPNLSEQDFDELDSSFHELIPKDSALFNDTSNARYKKVLIQQDKTVYDLKKIKRALFAELVIPKTRSLMNKEQENFVHFDFDENILLHGLPGSGKSSSLISKALYEKMKRPELNLMIFAKRSCSVHKLQALVFAFIENSHWGLNPADIIVSSFDSIKRRVSEKEKYDLVICDDLNQEDLSALLKLLRKEGQLMASSHNKIDSLKTMEIPNSYRLPPSVCAACEGLRVDNLKKSLSFLSGNIFMNVILSVANLLKEVDAKDICIVNTSKEDLLSLQGEIDSYFSPITYLFDDNEKKEGIGLYPFSHLSCLSCKYMIIIIDEKSLYDPIELISRAQIKTFILSQSEDAYNIINTIKEGLLD
ncbi:MAG: hypothetical protein COA44_11980 [Arcobacter sp.]|nr:MAG: hypothetical protein COA44_11980 [Arcobacter sp.]